MKYISHTRTNNTIHIYAHKIIEELPSTKVAPIRKVLSTLTARLHFIRTPQLFENLKYNMHISICKSVYYSIKLYNVPLKPRATRLRCDLIFSSSPPPPPSYKTNKYSTEKARVSTEKARVCTEKLHVCTEKLHVSAEKRCPVRATVSCFT